jgi:hypothetical protein
MDIIVGGGKYGCHAVEYLRQKGRSFVVVDTDTDCVAQKKFSLKPFSVSSQHKEQFTQGDIPEVLELIDVLTPEYVFPTAPVHIAAEMAQKKFTLAPWPEAIDSITPRLPQAVVLLASKGKLIVSFNRDHDCIENCSMPEVCPTSKIKKPCAMTKMMKYASPEACILISHSMAPGMGALKGAELGDFFDWAKTKDQFIVGTACDCHGVFSAFKKI